MLHIFCLSIRLRLNCLVNDSNSSTLQSVLIDKQRSMQNHDQISALEVDSDAVTLVDTTDLKNARTSMIYQVLPTMVSSHLPTIPSIRRSIGEIRDRRMHSKTNSLTELPQPGTPPPGYSERPGSGSATPNRRSLVVGDADLEFADDASDRPGSAMSSNPPPFSAYETKTGINWKYAGQGTNPPSHRMSFTC